MAVLTDVEIADLLAAPKKMAGGTATALRRLRDKAAHREAEVSLASDVAGTFRIVLRTSRLNPLDFSAILVYRLPSGQDFRLCRYNGKSHSHTNRLERDSFYHFHIHTATERYQDQGMREDSFAVVSNRYGDIWSALRCLVEDANIDVPDDTQLDLI
jgi:hypothetical protein